MTRRQVIDYTIYSPDYIPDAGECWDYPTFRSAKRKAMSFGPGSLVVRDFNTFNGKNEIQDWWQSERCWLWDGLLFRKVLPSLPDKWLIKHRVWWAAASSLRQLRRKKR